MGANTQRDLREPIRVLQYTYGGGVESGIDSYLIDIYQSVDHRLIQFDFLYRYRCPLVEETQRELRTRGGKVSSLEVEEAAHPVRRQVQEMVALWRFFHRNRYEIVEINMTALFMILNCAIAARLHGTKVVIVHAHDAVKTEGVIKRILKWAFSPVLEWVCTDFWACSRHAAQYLFSSRRFRRGDWNLIKNGIDVKRFGFDLETRTAVRELLGMSSETCVGMVGRFTNQKNHEFALRVIDEARHAAPDIKLVLVGGGPLIDQTTSLVKTLGLTDNVVALGVRQDVNALMAAFDVLLAPSRHEGFPLIALEAQCADLQLLVSDAFPIESDVTGNMVFLGLDRSPREWAEALLALPSKDRRSRSEDIINSGYCREATASFLQPYYAQLVGRGAVGQ